ncbi:histidine phosphatase family protein [Novosphingobium sp. BL-52-GroH]|uniref:histidine phosphatase family protein n=1 Tax=Novosphingobium sp. BL-52-GroH TaxID=3349877 RepID=UPI00384C8D9D
MEPPQPHSRWPELLWLIRHGQSAGNVARDAAHESGEHRIALDHRDVDVPLSALGMDQAQALGRWFEHEDERDRPEVILCSPYVRAVQTAELLRESICGGSNLCICIDERLREKEFGILDGLTTIGIHELQPQQAEFRKLLGKFYHRPPGGESWVDVIFRLRAVMDTISLHYAGRRVMIVAHQVVVLCMRYVLEQMTEAQILAIDAEGDVANCGVTRYRFDPQAGDGGKLVLDRYNAVAPLEQDGTRATREPDKMVAARG